VVFLYGSTAPADDKHILRDLGYRRHPSNTLPPGRFYSGAAYGACDQKGVGQMLTAKQEKFVQNIIQGMSQADAYRSAYPNQRMSDKSVWETASKLMTNPKVISRLNELRDKLASESIMSAQERMEWLTQIIKDKDEGTNDKLKAVDILNRMSGEYVTKIDGNLSVAKLEDLI
jgi:phage terminase small subunit